MLITLPIFMIIYRVVSICRPMKTASLFNLWTFAKTPTTEIFSNFTHDGWLYLMLLLIILPVQFLSMRLPQIWARRRNKNASSISIAGIKQMKKSQLIQIVMTCVMCGIVAFSPTGVGVYWFLSALFSILQSYIMHHVILKSRRKGGQLEKKLDSFLSA
jgi:YidC/Oxa1 family membrane protein insertase